MSRTLQPQDQVAHYRVVGPLGAGGMGEVYLAQDQKLERNVALKVLPPQLVRNEERVRRFVLEAKSASSLSHPNIVTIYEIGHEEVKSSDGQAPDESESTPVHFISMELVSGETLTQKIHDEKADLRTLLGYLAQAAEGVAKAHSAGIIHRDLKPGNIMVSKDGFAKVLDFGLAKLTEKQPEDAELSSAPTEVSEKTGEGVVMGSVGYMSPEQVRAKGVDARSDIFSFGCILYEAATRRRPFVAETGVETMHKILHEKPEPVDAINPQVPSEVRRLVRRCLAKSPDQRLQSMKDLAIELREIVEEYDTLSPSGTSAGSITSAAMAAPPARRTGMRIGIAAAALIGVVGIAFGIWSLTRDQAAAPPAAEPFQSMRMSSLFSRPDIVDAVLSGDGRYLAYVSGEVGQRGLRVRQVATGSDVEILSPRERTPEGIGFSPDGNYLYYLDRDPETPNYRALFQVPSLGGTPVKRAFDVDTAPSFSPDGKKAVFKRVVPKKQANDLVVLNMESGEERLLASVPFPPQMPRSPMWSPDGRSIAAGLFTPTGRIATTITLFDVESGEPTKLKSGAFPWVEDLEWIPDGSGLVAAVFDLGRATTTQLWLVPYPDGQPRRITNDLNDYADLSISADSSTISAIRDTRISNLWIAPIEGGGARQVTFGTTSDSSMGNFDVADDRTVTFVAPRDQYSHLWAIGTDGSGRRQITSGNVFVFWHQAVEGERQLVWGGLGAEMVPHIWRVELEGGTPVQLTDGGGEFMQHVSPDGRFILFERSEAPRELWIVPSAGGDARRIATESAGDGPFSPDSEWVLVAKEEAYEGRTRPAWTVVPSSGGEEKARLRLPPGAQWIRWMPDGEGVSFLDRADGARTLYRQDLEGGKPVRLAGVSEGRIVGYRWLEWGGEVLINHRVGRTWNLKRLPLDGGAPIPVTDFRSGGIWGFDLTPDGRSVALTSGDQSRDVVLIRDFD